VGCVISLMASYGSRRGTESLRAEVNRCHARIDISSDGAPPSLRFPVTGQTLRYSLRSHLVRRNTPGDD
jgi:hypothetical protein